MPSELTFPLFIAVGFISGLLGGLLGIGGGVITVPFLTYFFLYSGGYPEKFMQIAISTSLAAAFVTAAVSSFFQMRKKAIQFSVLKWMLPTLILGCIAGALTAHHMASRTLSFAFGLIAIGLGFYFFFPKLPLSIARFPNWSLSLFALGIGGLSSMLGIGGGSVAFPILLGYQIPVKNASAISSAATFFTTGIGTAVFLYVAWDIPSLPGMFGYIDLPAWIAISIGSMITSPIGVKLAHSLPVARIKRIFGCCLVLIGLSMLLI